MAPVDGEILAMNSSPIPRPFAALFWIAALLLYAQGWTARLCADDPVDWPLAKSLPNRMQTEVAVTLKDSPLRRSLSGLCKQVPLALVLDRRVDPDQLLDFNASQVSLKDAIVSVARERGVAPSFVGFVAYVGPTETSRRLRTVMQLRLDELDDLPKPRRAGFRKVASWSWDELAEPRQLVGELAEQAGVTVENLEAIPHDLWAGATLPPLRWTERMSLVLAQFHATYQVDDRGERITIVPIADDVAVEKDVKAGKKPEETLAEYRRLLPDCEVTLRGRRIHIRGLLEDLERVQSTTSGGKVTTRVKGPPVSRYTLTYEGQPLRPLLERIAMQTKLTLQLDKEKIKAAGLTLEQKVTVVVKDATLDELLSAALRPYGLDFRLTDREIEVFPATQ